MNKRNIIDSKINTKIKMIGHSMYPLLQDEDIVYCKDTLYKDIQENDIIIIKKDKIDVPRRVVYKNSHYLITKADNVIAVDPKVARKNSIRKVISVKRRGYRINPEIIYQLQSSLYLKEIATINNLFRRNRINYILLKGLPLHLYYEKSPPRRLYADCDILVSPSDFEKIKRIFLKKGYKKTQNSILVENKKGKQKYGEESFFKKVNEFKVVLDVHTEPVFLMTQLNVKDIFYPSALIDTMNEAFFKNKRTISFNSQKISILSPTHLIVYLTLHFFHHNYRGAYRLSLINKIITREKTDNFWKDMEKLIKKYQLGNYVFIVFELLKKYYCTQIPDKFLKNINPKQLIGYLLIRYFSNTSTFNGEERTVAGIHRFILLFLLSPLPWYRKMMALLRRDIGRNVLAVLQKRR